MTWRRPWCVSLIALLSGCGGGGETPVGGVPETSAARRVQFVGFDASGPLVAAIKDGKLQGVVVQNPMRIGSEGVRQLVAHLRKAKVAAKITTGETLVTRENLDSPDVSGLINAPKVEASVDAGSSGPRAKKWRVMVIPKGTTHEFWQTIHAGAARAAAELGDVELIWQSPQKEDDRTLQIQLVQGAIAAGVDGIVLAPLDARALVAPVEEAVAKGIPVVIIDSALESTKPVSYVATDNYHGGVLAAKRLGELLGGQGRIILIRYAVGSAATQEREQGFTDTMAKEFPKVVYVSDDQYAGATSDSAQRVAQNLVTRYRGQFDGIFTPNESSTLGTLRALESAGLVSSRP